MKKILFALLSGLVLCSNAFAWGFKELGEEAASPYTTSAKYVLFGGTALTYLFAVTEDQVGDPFQQKQVRNKTLGHSSSYGNIFGQMVPNVLYVGGMSIAGYYGDDKGYKRAMGMFKATAYAASVTTVLKYTIREPRPNDNSTRNSFPSGHSTTAFAFAGYVAAEHGWGWGAAATTLATFTAYSRINDNMHRLHDVFAGATIGWVYGWGIARLEQDREKEKKKEESHAYVAPIYDSSNYGLSYFREF